MKCVPSYCRWSLFLGHFPERHVCIKIKDMNPLTKCNIEILSYWFHLCRDYTWNCQNVYSCRQRWKFFKCNNISISVQIGIMSPFFNPVSRWLPVFHHISNHFSWYTIFDYFQYAREIAFFNGNSLCQVHWLPLSVTYQPSVGCLTICHLCQQSGSCTHVICYVILSLITHPWGNS